MTEALRETPLVAEHAARGARLVPFAGYRMPLQYAGITREHEAVRQRAGLFDVSHMGEVVFAGPAAAAVLDELVTSHVATLEVGAARYGCVCNERGGVVDDVIVYRLSDDRFLVVCNASNRARFVEHATAINAGRADLADESDDVALVAIQGPRAADIVRLAGASDATLALGRFRFRDDRVAGVAVRVARTGYTGEDGFELFAAASDAPALWRGLLAAGEPSGLEPAGLGARDTLRLEACLPLHGHELAEDIDPFEAGLAWTVKLDKPSLVGATALAASRAEPRRALIGLELLERGIARAGYAVLGSDGSRLGVCTSGGPSPTLGKSIALALVTAPAPPLESTVVVDCRGKPAAARVVRTPFYRRPAPR